MRYRVIKPHVADRPNPLIASAGDRLSFERRPTQWAGWLWCVNSDGVSGWVPESWVVIDGSTCVMIRDYNATELTANIDDIVEGDIIESGWIWGRNQKDQQGWVPMECVERA